MDVRASGLSFRGPHRPQLDARILRLVKHRLVDPDIRDQLRQRVEALRARTADEAASSCPTLERELAKLKRKIPALLDRLTLLPPEAARLVGAELEKLGREREAVRSRLQETKRLTQAASAFLMVLGSGPRLFMPTAVPSKRARILGRAVERVLADLEESSPEALRDRLKALVRRVMVHGNGKIESATSSPFSLTVAHHLRDAFPARGLAGASSSPAAGLPNPKSKVLSARAAGAIRAGPAGKGGDQSTRCIQRRFRTGTGKTLSEEGEENG